MCCDPLVAFLKPIIGHARVQVMHVMEPDFVCEPLQDRRQAQVGRTLQGRSRRLETIGCRVVRYHQRCLGLKARYSPTVRQEE